MTAIQTLFVKDKQILEGLGLTLDSPDLDKHKRIIKRSIYEGLATSDRRLNLYFRPSRATRNEIITNEILQVDVHVPATQDYYAYRVQKRVRELLHKKQVGTMILHFDGQLGELPSMQGFICVGSRYSFYRVI
ncbi:MAG TPA: hypothetical protein PKI14_11055 [Fervidobacterium sp.]|nr:hypothetical protein [Fervidobacterium sp.]